MAMAHMKNKFRATTNPWLFFSTPAGAVSTQRPKHYELLLEGKWSHQMQWLWQGKLGRNFTKSAKKKPWTHPMHPKHPTGAGMAQNTPQTTTDWPLAGFLFGVQGCGHTFFVTPLQENHRNFECSLNTFMMTDFEQHSNPEMGYSSSGRIPIHFPITCRMPDNSRNLTCDIMEPEHMPKIQKRNSLNIIYELYMFMHH